MNLIAYFISFLIALSAYPISIDINWSDDFDKSLTVQCEENRVCERSFLDGVKIVEDICDNCFSNDVEMSFLFNSIDRELSRGDEASFKVFFRFIILRQFVSIDYKSPYDLVTNSSLITKKIKFRKLCDDYSQEPIVFYSKTYYNQISKPKFIFCGDKVYYANLFQANERVSID